MNATTTPTTTATSDFDSAPCGRGGPLPALDVEDAALKILAASVAAGELGNGPSLQALVRNAFDLAAEFVAYAQWRRMEAAERQE